MSYWDLLLLSIIQGVAEFLPISSSGHLTLAEHWLGVEEAKGTLTIVLHFGTLLSILVFYVSRIWRLLNEDRRVMLLLIVGTLPAVFFGLLIKRNFKGALTNEWLAASMLLVTGGILIASRFLSQKPGVEYRSFSLRAALGVGLFQAFAILPGISRSGTTIYGGQLLGLKRESAATFSFLLAIPAILGATVLEIVDLWRDGTWQTTPFEMLIVGALISFGVGYVSLAWLIQFIQKGKFYLFAWWCIPVGLISLLALAIGG